MIRIVHAADLHLDPPFSGESIEVAAQRRREFRESFVKLVKLCEDRCADILLISGDLFDRRGVSGETLNLVFETLSKSGVQTFIVPGNHDYYTPGGSPYSGKTELDNPCVFFQDELCEKVISVRDERVRVCGYAFTSHSIEIPPFRGYTAPSDGAYNILLAHGNIYSSSVPDCPIKMKDISDSGFDYIALGHIHLSDGIHKEGNTYYGYSGHLEPRSFADLGEGGAYVIDIDKQDGILSFNYEFVRLAKRKYSIVYINASKKDASLEEKVSRLRELNLGENDIVRAVFEGGTSENEALPIEELKNVLSSVGMLEIHDETVPLYSSDYLENDKGIFGELKDVLSDALESENDDERELASLALKYAIEALHGNDITDIITETGLGE